MNQDVLSLYKKAQNVGLNAQEVFWLEGQAAAHPAFSLVHTILARHHFRNQSTIKNKALLKAAAYSNNRRLLRGYLEDTLLSPKSRPLPVAEIRQNLDKKESEPQAEETPKLNLEKAPNPEVNSDPVVEAPLRLPEVDVQEPSMEIVVAPAEQPVVEAVDEQPTIEAAVEQPAIEAVAEQPNIEAAVEQPVVEAVAEQPSIEATAEQPVTEPVAEQPVPDVKSPESAEAPVPSPMIGSGPKAGQINWYLHTRIKFRTDRYIGLTDRLIGSVAKHAVALQASSSAPTTGAPVKVEPVAEAETAALVLEEVAKLGSASEPAAEVKSAPQEQPTAEAETAAFVPENEAAEVESAPELAAEIESAPQEQPTAEAETAAFVPENEAAEVESAPEPAAEIESAPQEQPVAEVESALQEQPVAEAETAAFAPENEAAEVESAPEPAAEIESPPQEQPVAEAENAAFAPENEATEVESASEPAAEVKSAPQEQPIAEAETAAFAPENEVAEVESATEPAAEIESAAPEQPVAVQESAALVSGNEFAEPVVARAQPKPPTIRPREKAATPNDKEYEIGSFSSFTFLSDGPADDSEEVIDTGIGTLEAVEFQTSSADASEAEIIFEENDRIVEISVSPAALEKYFKGRLPAEPKLSYGEFKIELDELEFRSLEEADAESVKELASNPPVEAAQDTTPAEQAAPPKPRKKAEDLIERFIENEPMITRANASSSSPGDLARESSQANEDWVTETLARIYEKQGNKSKALKIYEKLRLRFPEKSDYFGLLIEKLKQ